MRTNFGRCVVAAFGLVATAGFPARAADLDAPGIGPPPRHFIATVAPARAIIDVVPPNCRLIRVPRLNLSRDDVVGANPQLICFSRGVLADTVGW